MRLSKSSIGTFKQCQFRFKIEKIDKWKPPVIPPQLKKGIEVHKIFELAFTDMQDNMSWFLKIQKLTTNMKKDENFKLYKEDCLNFIKWQSLRRLPIETELDIYNEELHFRGIIDRVEIDREDKLCIIDYKTGKGKKYLSSYYDELYMYAYIYEKHSGKTVDKIGVYFSGSHRFLEKYVDRERMQKAIDKIQPVREQINECIKTNNWRKVRTPLCGWCALFNNNECDGEDNELFAEVIPKW